MASKLMLRYRLPDWYASEKLLADEEFSSYILDGTSSEELDFVSYDTPAWDLYSNDYTLCLFSRRGQSAGVLTLGENSIKTPGVFSGKQWAAAAGSVEEAISVLPSCGAPDEFAALAAGKTFSPIFTIRYTRISAILYLPHDTRAELRLYNGRLRIGEKEEPLLELQLELLYGDFDFLYEVVPIFESYGLTADALSRHDKAIRLLRSR